MDLLKRQENKEGQTQNYLPEFCKFGNKFKFFEDSEIRWYSLSLLGGLEDVDLEEILTIPLNYFLGTIL